MTVCRVAVANLAMWVRDHYFPASYAQAIWKRLLPFFQLPSTITQDATLIQVEPRPFNDRVPNQNLAVLYERVNQARGEKWASLSMGVAQEMVEERLSRGLAVRSMAGAQRRAVPRNERMVCLEQGAGPL